jgi:hypothetical protein
MQIDEFAWMQPIPRTLYNDKPAMYDLMMKGWEVRLSVAHGRRVSGPLRFQVSGFGYIDDMSLKEVLVKSELSIMWTYAIVRISGPAIRP